MTIPLNRIYHYIENIAEEVYGNRVVIYRFWPNGSKNLSDLNPLRNLNPYWLAITTLPIIWANDQEPLDYEFYKNDPQPFKTGKWTLLLKSLNFFQPNNLNYNTNNIFEKSLLLHSEKRSFNLEKYLLDGEVIPVYYWSHAVIALDWFRYAKHEPLRKDIKKIFLIYNRAWSGTREYRLKFTEFLITSGLENHCQASINPVEPELGIHYNLHTFKNPAWRPNTVLENFFPPSTAQSHYSADFDIDDYNSTEIEVVLETLFDDSRIHLTEKSLRPIACGQPFILAGPHGSLEYLRSYGFKTFNHIWDEGYDLIENPEERLIAITDLMKQITTWSTQDREYKMSQALAIADYNKKHFFSDEFFNLITNELTINLTSAFTELKLCNNYISWLAKWKKLLTYPEINEFLQTNQKHTQPTNSHLDIAIKLAQSKLSENQIDNKGPGTHQV